MSEEARVLSLIMDAETRLDGWYASRDANFGHVTLILHDIEPILDALRRGSPTPVTE